MALRTDNNRRVVGVRAVTLRTPGMQPVDSNEAPVHDRTARLNNYDVEALAGKHVVMVGAGGLGGEIGHGLERDGIGNLTICDADTVQLSNLNRQRFYPRNLYKNKALELAKELVAEATQPGTITGLAMNIQQAIDSGLVGTPDLIIAGVDNNAARVYVARWALEHGIPAIFTAVNTDADRGYVFVQTSRPGDPCYGCLFPDALNTDRQAPMPCAVGSSLDILKVMGGMMGFAVGAILMPARRLGWHYKEVSLAGGAPDGIRVIKRRDNCPLCSAMNRARSAQFEALKARLATDQERGQ